MGTTKSSMSRRISRVTVSFCRPRLIPAGDLKALSALAHRLVRHANGRGFTFEDFPESRVDDLVALVKIHAGDTFCWIGGGFDERGKPVYYYSQTCVQKSTCPECKWI